MAKPATQVPSTRPSWVVAEQMPDFMKGKSGQGTEALSSGDVALPLIKLAQALSKEITEGTIPDLKVGDFYHSLTEDILGQEFRAAILYCDIRAILFRPRDSGGGILARSDDLKTWSPSNATFDVTLDKSKKAVQWKTKGSVVESGLLEFGSSDPDQPSSQPAGNRMYNMVVWLPDYPDISPSLITCQRSAISPAKKILGKFKMSRAPSYGIWVKVQSVNDTNNANQSFKNYRFVTDGFVTEKETFDVLENWYKMFESEGVKIREDQLAEAASDINASEGAQTATAAPAGQPKY